MRHLALRHPTIADRYLLQCYRYTGAVLIMRQFPEAINCSNCRRFAWARMRRMTDKAGLTDRSPQALLVYRDYLLEREDFDAADVLAVCAWMSELELNRNLHLQRRRTR